MTSKQLGALAIGVAATLGVIIMQFLLPFAFDFISDIALVGVGVWMGKAMVA